MSGGRQPWDPGDSPVARAFDATVKVTRPGVSLYLVTGRSGQPQHAVAAAGGRCVLVMPGVNWVIAVLPVSAAPLLQAHPDVASSGPVNLDAQRFARVAGALGGRAGGT